MPDRDMSQYIERRRTHPRTYSLTNNDKQLLERIADYHGCGMSEAVRMAVRFYAVSLDLRFQNPQEKIGGDLLSGGLTNKM